MLSDEWRLSRYAYVSHTTWARARPTRRSRAVRRLRPVTADDTAELVLLLEDLGVEGDAGWVRVRLPMRPAGRTGWIRRVHLSEYRTVRTALRIDRRRRRATLYRAGRRVWQAPVGVGKPGTPTPAGRFYIRERLVPRRGTVYGVLAFGTSAYSAGLTDWPGGGVIGIHGTNEPRLIPGAVSHGCVRLRNGKIARLDRLMSLGTPVEIR